MLLTPQGYRPGIFSCSNDPFWFAAGKNTISTSSVRGYLSSSRAEGRGNKKLFMAGAILEINSLNFKCRGVNFAGSL